MIKDKILHLSLLIIPICKIIDVLLAQMFSIGEISFEFDGAYYIVMGFVNQNLFKENKLIFSSLFRIEERLLVGKKPPDEITDNARFSDIKDLNSKIL